jgi:hypothetical protein
MQSALQAKGEAAEERVLEAEADDPVLEPICLSENAAVVDEPRLA